MEKRVIIAIALSILVIVAFQKLMPAPAYKQAAQIQTESTVKDNVSQARLPQSKPKTAEKPKAILANVRTGVETDEFSVSLSSLTGAIQSAELKEYAAQIFDNADAVNSLGAMALELQGRQTVLEDWALTREAGMVKYVYTDNENGFSIKKTFEFVDGQDYIRMTIGFSNEGSGNIMFGYSVVGPSCIMPVESLKGRNFIAVDAEVDGKIIRKSRAKNHLETISGIVSWVDMRNRYYTVAMKAFTKCTAVILKTRENGRLATEMVMGQRSLFAGAAIEDTYLVYIGPIERDRLGACDPAFKSIVDFGFFGSISIILLNMLGWIHGIVHNWGVAIIMVTLLINIVLYPLTKKSFTSMRKMQEIQPHMEKLKQLHKDNPQRMNKEVMELYKKYNVNPFGGCLPMLLQMPIFLAFYQVLLRSIQLKNAGFLWIKDLSAPDAIFVLKSSLPFIGNKINILPLLTAVVMVLQQRVTMKQSAGGVNDDLAKQQRLMAIFFPIFFCFILYNFPAGLILYWLTNSILMTTEQYYLRKQMSKD
ncbi:MAG: membrane protein insertase YidC [Candidatus Omnitrophota bacterium]